MAFFSKVCAQCGEKYLARSSRGQFCTQDCGQRHRRTLQREDQKQAAVQDILNAILKEHE